MGQQPRHYGPSEGMHFPSPSSTPSLSRRTSNASMRSGMFPPPNHSPQQSDIYHAALRTAQAAPVQLQEHAWGLVEQLGRLFKVHR
jgi:hypothetical protein